MQRTLGAVRSALLVGSVAFGDGRFVPGGGATEVALARSLMRTRASGDGEFTSPSSLRTR